ncbi:MAG: T9SS type A sorting domain-containing protein [Salinivirgaceae bacterium]|jgi:hypothetical protein|nr:T9SS type A sorting domain-containing protein [Salinivirgaceae bacterium]
MNLKTICLAISSMSMYGIFAQTVTPEVDGSIYSLNFKNTEFKVDASRGAKVRSFALNGSEFLVSEDQSSGFLWGSTLWPAPQSWPWPLPFEQIEDGEYTASVVDNVMSFESVVELDMQFKKEFWANESDTTINIRYALTNKGASQMTVALWELTRPPVNGLTFWPTGPKGVWGNPNNLDMDLSTSVVVQGDHSWLDIDAENRSDLKFFADGSKGWFAHVDADRKLFVKTFDDVDQSDFADGEAELELWIAGVYIELENQSAAKTLEPDEELVYELKWYIRDLPARITPEIGNADLLAYVYSVIGLDPPAVSVADHKITHRVYPNPVNNFVQFGFDSNGQSVKVEIYDITGKRYASQQIESNSSIDISEYDSGIYMYSISINGNIEKGKFIKQ